MTASESDSQTESGAREFVVETNVTDGHCLSCINMYKQPGAKHFFRTIMQGTVHPRQVLGTRQTTKSSKIGSALTPTRVNAT